MLKITNENNYLLKIVRLKNFTQHPNAERLLIWDVDGYKVITNLDYNPGDLCVLIQPETQLSGKIIHALNMFSDPLLNKDTTVRGYVGRSRRIKAVKLRDIISEGLLLKVEDFFKYTKIDINCIKEGIYFDTVNGEVISNKYEIIESAENTGNSKLHKFMSEEDFPKHYDTKKLQDTNGVAGDIIVITEKLHGTSARFGRVLTEKKLNFFQKILTLFGKKYPKEYAFVFGTRNTIKYVDGKYNACKVGDEWMSVFNRYIKNSRLDDGVILYGEIVGYKPSGGMIQKYYDYGCAHGDLDFYVYDVVINGRYLSTVDAEVYCRVIDLKFVPMLEVCDNMEKNDLLEYVSNKYLEVDCPRCKSNVPREGVCIRGYYNPERWIKVKSKRFLLKETEVLDEIE